MIPLIQPLSTHLTRLHDHLNRINSTDISLPPPTYLDPSQLNIIKQHELVELCKVMQHITRESDEFVEKVHWLSGVEIIGRVRDGLQGVDKLQRGS